MRIQAYAAISGTLVIAVYTARPEGAPSIRFTAAKVHEDYAAAIRTLLREWRQVGESALQFPDAARLTTYLPAPSGRPFYALRQLQPAGAPRDIDDEAKLEIIRPRYEFTLHLTPEGIRNPDAEAVERHLEYAMQRLLAANGIEGVYIPGDDGTRAEQTHTIVDVICELGASTDRRGFDVASS